MDGEIIETLFVSGDRVLVDGNYRGRVDHDGDPNDGDFIRVKYEGYDVRELVSRERITWQPPKRKWFGKLAKQCFSAGSKSCG